MNLNSGWLATALMLFAVLACGNSQSGNSSSQQDLGVRVIGTHTNRFKMVNKYVLVEKGLSTEKLTELAKKLHKSEPDVTFWFVDDDSKSEEMLAFIKAYEKAEKTAEDPMFNWIADHTVANLQQYFGEGGKKYWALSKGMFGERITTIE